MKQFRPSQGFAYSQYNRRRFNKVAKALGVEKKFVEYSVGENDISQTLVGSEIDPATALTISGVAIGDGARNRDGRTITLKSVHVHGIITSYTPNDRIVRVVLVRDKQTNGAQFNAEDVLLPTTGTNDVNAFRNLDFIKRFDVLKDLTIVVNTNHAQAGAISTMRHFKIDVPLNVEVDHRGGTDSVTDITDNSLHLLAVTNGNDMTYKYVARTRFVG